MRRKSASVAAGVPKFISQSVAFAYRFDQGTKTEDSPCIGAAAGEMGDAMESLEQQTLNAPGGIGSPANAVAIK